MSTAYFQCLLGMQCADFAIIAADQTNIQSILLMKNDENKIHHLSERLMMGLAAAPGDAAQLTQFISKNLALYKMRNDYELDNAAVVHFTRRNLVNAIESGDPAVLNMLVAGYDDESGGQLYSMDTCASCVKVPFAVHGFGGLLSFGILDRYYNYTMSAEEAYNIMKLCVQEIHQRLIISLPNFQVKVVSKDGIKELPTINCFSFPPEQE